MKKKLIIAACLIAAIPVEPVFSQNVRNDQVQSLKSNAGGAWGDWSETVFCPPGTWAAGYTMRVESSQGKDDDTALNAVALYCRDRNGNDKERIVPHQGYWGNWVEAANCPSGTFIRSFRLKVEGSQDKGDDIAASSVAFRCTNNDEIKASGGPWGSWGPWRNSSTPAAICGVSAKVESPQGSGDDTALNDLEFTWCSI